MAGVDQYAGSSWYPQPAPEYGLGDERGRQPARTQAGQEKGVEDSCRVSLRQHGAEGAEAQHCPRAIPVVADVLDADAIYACRQSVCELAVKQPRNVD